jgi:antitoxin VapB
MKTVKVSNAGGGQIVEIPSEFRIEGDAVEVHREGDSLVLTPIPRSWQSLIDSLDMFTEDFMEEGRRQLPPQIREPFQP